MTGLMDDNDSVLHLKRQDQAKRLADAKAEGRREGLIVAILAIDGLMSDGCDQSGHDIPADCYECVAAIRALLPPAPSEGGESGKVGG